MNLLFLCGAQNQQSAIWSGWRRSRSIFIDIYSNENETKQLKCRNHLKMGPVFVRKIPETLSNLFNTDVTLHLMFYPKRGNKREWLSLNQYSKFSNNSHTHTHKYILCI